MLTGSPLASVLAEELPEKPQGLVPTIVQLELAKWMIRERGQDNLGRE